jgi:hypothetical protein
LPTLGSSSTGSMLQTNPSSFGPRIECGCCS